jgi:hypothetical protein
MCDFQDTGVMSSSFADEVFGKLAYGLGLSSFRSRVSFHNISTINELLITRALRQRLLIPGEED